MYENNINNEKNNHKKLSSFIIVLIILAVAIIAMLVYNIITKNDTGEGSKKVIDTTTGKVLSNEEVELYNMSESERVKYYFNTYIDYLGNKEYENAYNMLDDKFKNNYFKTVESYKNYIEKKYSPIISVTYDDLTRMGDYYILDITFLDLFSSTNENMVGKSQKFVIYETDYGKYTISFQAE